MASTDATHIKCRKCGSGLSELAFLLPWERQHEIISCPGCHTRYEIAWDDIYNESTGEVRDILFLNAAPIG